MAAPVPAALTSHRGRHIGLAWLGLLALAGASWALSLASLGAWAAPVALTVASVKAVIVAAIFMRITHASRVARIALLLAFGFIALLSAGVIADVLLR